MIATLILTPQLLPPSFPIQLQHMMQPSQQKGDIYGRLLPDDGMYCIAKAIY